MANVLVTAIEFIYFKQTAINCGTELFFRVTMVDTLIKHGTCTVSLLLPL